MSGHHGFDHRHLHVHGKSRIHRLSPQSKLAGLVAFVLAVALTPRQWIAAFVIEACIVAAVVAAAHLPPRFLAARLATISPFVGFAIFLPFFGDGETTSIGPLTLSVDGLWASWNILAKATLGATASIIVTATTPVPDLLSGLSRLRVPAAIVGIIGFMFRYLDLIIDQLARMRRAMVARGYEARWLWQARPIAASAGTLFVRTYERGERVHDAMAARGYTGTMPQLGAITAPRFDWWLAMTPAALAWAGLVLVGVA